MSRQTMLDPIFASRVRARLRNLRMGGNHWLPAASPAQAGQQTQQAQNDPRPAPAAPLQDAPDESIRPNPQPIESEASMIKLNCGVSRKVGEPDYGSRGATCNVELELESSATQDGQLHERIRKLFSLARAAVDEELGIGIPTAQPKAAGTPMPEKPAPAEPKAQTNGRRPATEAQLRAITAICERLSLNADEQARQKFNHGIGELSLTEASTLIDQVKATNGSAR